MLLERVRLAAEIERMAAFLSGELAPDASAVLGLSGGLDCDVAARLLARSVGPARMKLFLVLQHGQDPKHLGQARALASELGCRLAEIDLREAPAQLVAALRRADPAGRFRPEGFLDLAKAKMSLRTAVLSLYTERGFVSVGSTNLTELRLGFFLPLGDGPCHLEPLAHLYKSEVLALARELGTNAQVLGQQPSAGCWEGETDLEDLAFWLVHGAPIAEQREFSGAELELAAALRAELSFGRIDAALDSLAGGADAGLAARASGLGPDTVARLRGLIAAATESKHRTFERRLPRQP